MQLAAEETEPLLGLTREPPSIETIAGVPLPLTSPYTPNCRFAAKAQQQTFETSAENRLVRALELKQAHK